MNISSLSSVLTVKRQEQEGVSFWKNAYTKDIPLLLFNHACPFLEERTNNYLSDLNNSQIRVKFSTVKTLKSGDAKRDFNITVRSKTGGEDYSLLSGGEQQMVNFAISLALSDLAETQFRGGSKMAVLDEPFTNLDARNCESVINFLNTQFLTKRNTVLLISNEDSLKQSIPKRINIVKKNGVSTLQEI